MAFIPIFKFKFIHYTGNEEEIVIANNMAIDISFKESVAPNKNTFQVTLHNFQIQVAEIRDIVELEIFYADEPNDVFTFQGVVEKPRYDFYHDGDLSLNFQIVEGGDILECPVVVNVMPKTKAQIGYDEQSLSTRAILVRLNNSLKNQVKTYLKKNKKEKLKFSCNLTTQYFNRIDPQDFLKKYGFNYFKHTGTLKDCLLKLLQYTGFNFTIKMET
jgi:hypothetical protein